MDDRIQDLLSDAATVQAVARSAGLSYDLVRRIYRAGVPWPPFGPAWQVGAEAARAGMDPTSYLEALAPLLHLDVDENERQLQKRREREPDTITEGDMAKHVELVAARTGGAYGIVRQVYGGITRLANAFKCKWYSPSWSLLLVILCLPGCATPYQPVGATGGYSEIQLDRNTFKVSFSGNGYTGRTRVETFLLHRCAELTVQHGYDYFVIVEGGTESDRSYYQTAGTYRGTTSYYGGTATTRGVYSPGMNIPITRHSGAVTIKMYQGEKPEMAGAYQGRELMSHLQAQFPGLLAQGGQNSEIARTDVSERGLQDEQSMKAGPPNVRSYDSEQQRELGRTMGKQMAKTALLAAGLDGEKHFPLLLAEIKEQIARDPSWFDNRTPEQQYAELSKRVAAKVGTGAQGGSTTLSVTPVLMPPLISASILRLAVVPLTAPATGKVAVQLDAVLNLLRLRHPQLTLVERDLKPILEEITLQHSGGVDDNQVVRVGKFAGVDTLLTYRIDPPASVEVRLLQVETGITLFRQTVEATGGEKSTAAPQVSSSGVAHASAYALAALMAAFGDNPLGIVPYLSGDSVKVSGVLQGSPAHLAGLRSGDKILSVNGQPFTTWTLPVSLPATLMIERGGQRQELAIAR